MKLSNQLSALLEEARSIQDGDPVHTMIGNLYFTRVLSAEEDKILTEYLMEEAERVNYLSSLSPPQFPVMRSPRQEE